MSARKLSNQSGQLLLEILIAITIAGVILALGSQITVVSLVSNKVAAERNVGLGLLEETIEGVQSVASEKWQNLYNLTHGTANYYPQQLELEGKWILTSGSEEVALNNITYTRSFNVRNVCRDTTTRHITGITDSDGTATTCNSSGGIFDPSTEKVTATVSWPNASPLLSEEYFAGRWRNKACNNTSWVTDGDTNVHVCPSTSYGTKTNIDTSNNELKLCDGC